MQGRVCQGRDGQVRRARKTGEDGGGKWSGEAGKADRYMLRYTQVGRAKVR